MGSTRGDEDAKLNFKQAREAQMEQVTETRSQILDDAARREAWVAIEDLTNHTLYAPCGCRMVRLGDGVTTRYPCESAWNRFPASFEGCADCRFELTAVPGHPVKYTPCLACRKKGSRPNWCWGWTKHMRPQDHAHSTGSKKKDYWPRTGGEGPLGVAVGTAAGFPAHGALFNVLRPEAEIPVALRTIMLDDWSAIEDPDNPARRAHNAQIDKRGRCEIAECPHTRGWR